MTPDSPVVYVEQALRAAKSGSAGHWPTVAAVLHDEVFRLRAELAAKDVETAQSATVPGNPAEPREGVGRLVRQLWVEWAREQPDPKPSWLLPWEEIDDGQREVDMRIGAFLFEAGQRSMSAQSATVDDPTLAAMDAEVEWRDREWRSELADTLRKRDSEIERLRAEVRDLRNAYEVRHTEDQWRVTVDVPLHLDGDLQSSLFQAVSKAVDGWQPEDRDGWDAFVSGYPYSHSEEAERDRLRAELADITKTAWEDRESRIKEADQLRADLAERTRERDERFRSVVHQCCEDVQTLRADLERERNPNVELSLANQLAFSASLAAVQARYADGFKLQRDAARAELAALSATVDDVPGTDEAERILIDIEVEAERAQQQRDNRCNTCSQHELVDRLRGQVRALAATARRYKRERDGADLEGDVTAPADQPATADEGGLVEIPEDAEELLTDVLEDRAQQIVTMDEAGIEFDAHYAAHLVLKKLRSWRPATEPVEATDTDAETMRRRRDAEGHVWGELEPGLLTGRDSVNVPHLDVAQGYGPLTPVLPCGHTEAEVQTSIRHELCGMDFATGRPLTEEPAEGGEA